jgi:hypothetical protein
MADINEFMGNCIKYKQNNKKAKIKPVQACNPSYSGSRNWKDCSSRQPREKFHEIPPISTNKNWA